MTIDVPFKMTDARSLALSMLTAHPFVIPGHPRAGNVSQSILDLFAGAGLVERTGALLTESVVPPKVTWGWALTATGRALSEQMFPTAKGRWWEDKSAVEFYQTQTGQAVTS